MSQIIAKKTKEKYLSGKQVEQLRDILTRAAGYLEDVETDEGYQIQKDIDVFGAKIGLWVED